MNVHMAGVFFVEADVNTTRLSCKWRRNVVSFHISGAGAEADFATKIAQHHISRSALEIDCAGETFNPLISRTALRMQRSIRRNRNFVIYGNTVVVQVVDVNVVSFLVNGRGLFDFINVVLPPAAEPGIFHVDFAADFHGTRGAVTDGDVAGAGQYLKIHGAADLKRALERAPDRSYGKQGKHCSKDKSYGEAFRGRAEHVCLQVLTQSKGHGLARALRFPAHRRTAGRYCNTT